MTQALSVKDLRVYYRTDEGPVKACDGVSFTLDRGDRLGLVGESGSGKSTTVLALLRLLQPPGRIEGGEALLDGTDLFTLSDERMRQVRGAEISMIPQGSMNSLNPVMRVKNQMIDTMTAHHEDLSRDGLLRRVHELLEMVGLNRQVAEMYPHELSGGMKQRVCMANAIALRPKVIIADEPTSALDVVVQKQVMDTLGKVQSDIGASVILVGHDMGLMAQFANRIAIMYAGRMMEIGPVEEIFDRPLHPYTRLLISTLPSLTVKGIFRGIRGLTPSLLNLPPGCAFHARCPQASEGCAAEGPLLQEFAPGHWVACHLDRGCQS